MSRINAVILTGAKKVTTSVGWEGQPKVHFDATQAAKDLANQVPVSLDTIYQILVIDDLGSGFGTDRIGYHARNNPRNHEDVEWFFDLMTAAAELGIDLGGWKVVIHDREDFVKQLGETNPDALREVDLNAAAPDVRRAAEVVLGDVYDSSNGQD